MKTLEIVGEKNFHAIAEKYGLTLEEQQAIRDLFEQWDGLMKLSDFAARMRRKTEIQFEKLGQFKPERWKSFTRAILEINVLFVKLSRDRQ